MGTILVLGRITGQGAAVKTLSLIAIAFLFNTLLVSAQTVNVTGKWILDVQTDAGSGTPTITFKQDGEKLAGHYSGQLGEAELTGTVKGSDISFSFAGDAQGQQFKVTYTGTVDKDTMKGSVDLGGLATGTFTGKKQ
jgi:hypothetical protein